jgi:hypothetical protein
LKERSRLQQLPSKEQVGQQKNLLASRQHPRLYSSLKTHENRPSNESSRPVQPFQAHFPSSPAWKAGHGRRRVKCMHAWRIESMPFDIQWRKGEVSSWAQNPSIERWEGGVYLKFPRGSRGRAQAKMGFWWGRPPKQHLAMCIFLQATRKFNRTRKCDGAADEGRCVSGDILPPT